MVFLPKLNKRMRKKDNFFDVFFNPCKGLVNNHSFQNMFTVFYRLIVAYDFSEP